MQKNHIYTINIAAERLAYGRNKIQEARDMVYTGAG